MAAGQVSVDAKAMGEGMAQAGHMAMHGIRFVTDSAALTADSDATLAQMTVLLKSQPASRSTSCGTPHARGGLPEKALKPARVPAASRLCRGLPVAGARVTLKRAAAHRCPRRPGDRRAKPPTPARRR